MKERQTHSPAVAAAKAGFSTAAAYRFEKDHRLPSRKREPRGRRRPDPLAEVWEGEVVALLKAAPSVRPVAIFAELRRRHPEIGPGVRRTLERRIRAWRAEQGPERDVIFRQEHPPGASAGPAWAVRLHRRDGAANRHRRRAAGASTLSFPARLEIVGRRNAANAKRIDQERAALRPLPPRRTKDHEDVLVRVASSSGFTLRKVFYSAPSRLIGHRLRVHLYDDRLDCFLGASKLFTLPRGRAHASGKHGHVVDYRHVIHALRRKPMALLHLVYRDQLFPRRAYARTFDRLLARESEPRACRVMVELLALAHERACEAELADLLEQRLDSGELPDLIALRERFAPASGDLPSVAVALAPLARYDEIAASSAGAAQ